jgi:hypothetical protein
MTDQSIMRISRCTEIKNDRDQAILWLDNLTFESGYIIMVSYYSVNPDNPERRFIDSILALGLKSGVGRDCYKVISVTKPRLIWGVCYMPNEIPDVSALVHGEEYLYHDPVTENWSLISCEDGSRKFTQISDYPQTLINLEDGTIWVSNENRRVRRLNDLADLYSREEIDRLLEYYEGTTNYNDLINKPSINGTSLVGNITIPIGDVNAIPVHYNTLVNLRDRNELIPGTFYRITDYITVTSQEGTTSAYNQFDIIVRADSENSLNENAFAAQPLEGQNSYFSNSNLSAWELKYCLDNDTRRFAWADSTTGTGVIYYMKDEWGNEAPYDFKNILFARYDIHNITSGSLSENLVNDLISYLEGDGSYGLFPESYMKGNVNFVTETKPIWRYTFDYKGNDASKEGVTYNNIIKPYIKNGVQCLNNGVINCSSVDNDKSFNNTIGYNCYDFTMSYGCYNCKCGNDCYGWISAPYCSGWTCGSESSKWISSYNCFDWNCGSGCEDWVCGSGSSLWSCGNNSSNWYVDPECYNWTCGMCCLNWHCAGDCYAWSCGNDCTNWSKGGCFALSCGNYCNDWSVKKGCNINIDSGTNSISINCGGYSDIKVCSGDYYNNSVDIRANFTTVGKDSRDSIVIYNPSDLIYSGGS